MTPSYPPASPTPELLFQMIEQNERSAQEDHQRLRESLREFEGWLTRHDGMLGAQASDLATLKATPLEATNLHFSPSVVLVIVTTCLTIGAGMWASTYGLRSDVRDILTKQDASSKLQEERSLNLHESIESVKRRQEAQQFEMQALKESLAKLTRDLR